MTIKWNKLAVKNLLSAIEFIEEAGYSNYAQKLESEILTRISELPKSYAQYPKDRFKSEIRIIRIRHSSRKPQYYKR